MLHQFPHPSSDAGSLFNDVTQYQQFFVFSDKQHPTYPIEQNRTKNQSNPIELQSFDWVRQSNKIEHLFFCEFDFRTNRTNIIEQNRTKSN